MEVAVPTIFVDNAPYVFEGEGRNLLEVCLSLGFNVPYFCWHPAMQSVGACRQCAVKLFRDETDAKGKIVMACMTLAADGTRISIDDPDAVAFRRRVIEWLMVNHPHDCPVCDEGGECHLQDMTVMTGHVYRRYRFTKRTHRNQYLGPLLNHEMNRCIQCYRCVRFYRDHAGGRDFDVLGWHDGVYFGRHQDGVLESEFAGNLVEVCPTGVFTDKTFKQHYTRKWDLQTAPSVCVHCGVGCNTIAGERYGSLRRIQPRFNGEVNTYFLCDRGRYGYEFVNGVRRVRRALVRGAGGTLEAAATEAALARAAEALARGRAIGIGSPRASLEVNFALRALVGPGNFYHGTAGRDLGLVRGMIDVLRRGPSRSASMTDTDHADAVFIVGEDVTNAAPLLALALRQAVLEKPMAIARRQRICEWLDAVLREAIQQEKGPFFVATPDQTKLDDVATATYRAAPDDIARLAMAVAHEIDPDSPAAPGLPEEVMALATRIAAALRDGRRPLVVSGSSCGSLAVARAAANVSWALSRTGRPAQLLFTAPECNSMGAALLDGGPLEAALAAVRSGAAETVIVAENDLYRRMDRASVDALLTAARHVILIDHLMHATGERAEAVLPAATFAEATGTLVNNEGRAQRFFQVFVPEGDVQAGWRWLGRLMVAAGKADAEPWPRLDDLLADLARQMPVFKDVPSISPPAGYRQVGQRIPRQPHRYSGRTAMTADLDVHEPSPPQDPDAPLAFSMEGAQGEPPSSVTPRYWAPGWNSTAAINKFQIEVGGPLHGGDPGRRIIEPAHVERTRYFADAPAAFVPRKGEWLVVPAWHIFGSEELSVLSPGIAELAPKPYVAVGAKDAERLGLGEGQEATLSLGAVTLRLAVRVRPALPQAVAGLPVGLPGMPWVALPAWGRLSGGDGGGRRQAPL
jgi:NADH-quinone oxidoreductase subunit G